MVSKFLIFALFGLMMGASSCLGGLVPAVPAAYSFPVATSYSAQVVNHAIATPVAAPIVAAAPIAPAIAPIAAYSAYGYGAPLIAGK